MIGGAGRKKYEKKTQDSQISITVYRTGSVADDTGTYVFSMAGKKQRPGYTDESLKRNGAAEGSTIITTETVYMKTETWEEIKTPVIKGLWNMNKYVKANPQWFMLEIFDGFWDRLTLLPAIAQRFKNKIISLKEEGYSPHTNQAYDNVFAKSDKITKDESLVMLRGMTLISQGVFDQWVLVQCGLYSIRDTNRETWTRSFYSCNMNPRT